MSPREKQFILLISLACVAIAIFSLVLYYMTHFLYIIFTVGFCSIAWYFHNRESLSARLGLNPRRGVTLPSVLRRWLTGRTVSGAPLSTPGRLRSRANKADVRNSGVYFNQRLSERGIYRTDQLERESCLFSPRDILMGSYIGKPESDPADGGRPTAGRSLGANPNPRVQLRERLSRPNYAVHTPNRRLSFTGEPQCSAGRFTITPQRHYPLQQMGTTSVGILPPAQWDSFRRKNVLSPRNAMAVHSPVTVKIARPDPRPSIAQQASSLAELGVPGPGAVAEDPCSRESVLRVLRESRKREVEEDADGRLASEQKSKRRRHDSGGSSHSAFESRLPNGIPSQLVPKPGTLKRGTGSAAEESVLKRSRTSSVGSATAGPPTSGTPGSARNPIRSSYSSSQGCRQWKRTSAHSSPLSSPGSSRSQTPERAYKKPREDAIQSPACVSSVSPVKAAGRTAPVVAKLAPKAPLSTAADVTASGKRKRKIQLVSSLRSDQIILPPPPELGYTVTAKDLDQEKEDALNKIHKVLLEPEPEKHGLSQVATAAVTPWAATPITTAAQEPVPTLSSLLAAPLPTSSSSPACIPLLEALKMKRPAPAGTTSSSASTTTSFSSTPSAVSPWTTATTTSSEPGSAKPTLTGTPALAPLSLSLPCGPGQLPSTTASSTFTQVLAMAPQGAQAARTPSDRPPTDSPNLFGLGSQLTSPPTAVSSASNPLLTSSNPLLTSSNPLVALSAASTTSNPFLTSSNSFLTSSVTSTVPNAFLTSSTTSTAPNTFLTSSTAPNPILTSSKPLLTSSNLLVGFSTASSTSNPLLTSSTSSTAPSSLLTSGFKPILGATSTGGSSSPAGEHGPKPAVPAFKPLFGSLGPPPSFDTATTSASVTTAASSTLFSMSGVTSGPASFSSSTSSSNPAPATKSLFGSWGAPPVTSASSASGGAAFLFGASSSSSSSTTNAPAAIGGFGSAAAFGRSSPAATTFGGFVAPAAAPPPASTQASFSFGKPTPPPAYPSAAPPPAAKQFSFGSSGSVAPPAPAAAPSPFAFGAATSAGPTFGTPSKPAFGAASSGFGFGSGAPASITTTSASAAPVFGPASSPAFAFGSGAAGLQQTPATTAASTGGFNFSAAVTPGQFGTPGLSTPATQMGGFSFGAAAVDKPAFGTSTPAFGQSVSAGPIPFGSPGTPVQGFNSVIPSPFGGAPTTPSFSIGAGSKPSGARQRLQARRQHTRKK